MTDNQAIKNRIILALEKSGKRIRPIMVTVDRSGRELITYVPVKAQATFGSLFAEGGNIVALQKMMGHSDIKTTMGYIHTSTQNLVDAKKERYSKSGKRIKLINK